MVITRCSRAVSLREPERRKPALGDATPTRPKSPGCPRCLLECGTEMDRQLPAYHLVRSPGRGDEAPTLDAAQRAVVDHGGGPLLVLAKPGHGQEPTTIVETVADRITNRGIDPERVLVLTFSRKAAEELRERITTRLHRTTRSRWR